MERFKLEVRASHVWGQLPIDQEEQLLDMGRKVLYLMSTRGQCRRDKVVAVHEVACCVCTVP